VHPRVVAASGVATYVLLTVVGMSVAGRVPEAVTPVLLVAGVLVGPAFLFAAWLVAVRTGMRRRAAKASWTVAVAVAILGWLLVGLLYWAVSQDYRVRHSWVLAAVFWPGFAWLETLSRAFEVAQTCGN